MKQLKSEDKYPAELWEETNAPAWDAERVWTQITAESSEVQKTSTYWWLPGLLLLLLLLTDERLGIELQSFPVDVTPHDTGEVQQVVNLDPDMEDSTGELPATSPLQVRYLLTPSLTPKKQADIIEQAPIDTLQAFPPVAKTTPVAGLSPMNMPLLAQKITPLPLSSRPGTKLSMRLPEPAPSLDSASYIKRLWVQLKRFNEQGNVDWEELGIQPNGDGTFSIIPAEKSIDKQDN